MGEIITYTDNICSNGKYPGDTVIMVYSKNTVYVKYINFIHIIITTIPGTRPAN